MRFQPIGTVYVLLREAIKWDEHIYLFFSLFLSYSYDYHLYLITFSSKIGQISLLYYGDIRIYYGKDLRVIALWQTLKNDTPCIFNIKMWIWKLYIHSHCRAFNSTYFPP